MDHLREAAKKGATPEMEGSPRQPGAQKQAPIEAAVRTKGPDGETHDRGSQGTVGRQPIRGGEKWDMATGKEAPAKDRKTKDAKKSKEEEEESEEEHKVEMELNSILKKGPSKHKSIDLLIGRQANGGCNSNNILQNILPLFRQSETYPARKIHHRSRTVRCGIRST